MNDIKLRSLRFELHRNQEIRDKLELILHDINDQISLISDNINIEIRRLKQTDEYKIHQKYTDL